MAPKLAFCVYPIHFPTLPPPISPVTDLEKTKAGRMLGSYQNHADSLGDTIKSKL